MPDTLQHTAAIEGTYRTSLLKINILQGRRRYGYLFPIPGRVPANQIQREDPVLDGDVLDPRSYFTTL